jgi:hypothetical protein
MGKIVVILCVVFVAFLASCADESGTVEVTVEVTATPLLPTSTPIPPTATSVPTPCDEVDGTCLYLYFDGENCVYEGPSEIKSGPVTFIYFNDKDESEGSSYVNMVRHTGDKTIQDMIDYIGEEPDTKHHPGWSIEIAGVFRSVRFGESHTWEGVLEPGVHTMICADVSPLGVYYGGGFTVED